MCLGYRARFRGWGQGFGCCLPSLGRRIKRQLSVSKAFGFLVWTRVRLSPPPQQKDGHCCVFFLFWGGESRSTGGVSGDFSSHGSIATQYLSLDDGCLCK